MIFDLRISNLDWLAAVADPIDWASRAGTLSMQGLLMLAIIFLAWVVIYLHRDQKRTQTLNHEENRQLQEAWMQKMEMERAAMSKERVDRINMLMTLIREDTQAKIELRGAIENNTKTIERFETLLTKLIGTKVVL